MNISDFYNHSVGPTGPGSAPATNTLSVDLFAPNSDSRKRLFVVDEFYQNPDLIREYALQVRFIEDNRWYKGKRSEQNYLTPGVKSAFETIIGQPISPVGPNTKPTVNSSIALRKICWFITVICRTGQP